MQKEQNRNNTRNMTKEEYEPLLFYSRF